MQFPKLARHLRRGLASITILSAFASLPALAQVMSTSGNVEQRPLPPNLSPLVYTSASKIRVFNEKMGTVLSSDLVVDIVHPGAYGPAASGTYAIPAGTRVQSHLIHFDRPGTSALTLSGSISFRNPILGIITEDQSLDDSDGPLGRATTTYPAGVTFRGIDLTLISNPDFVTFEHNELDINLTTTVQMDQIRVVTAAQLAFSLDLGSASGLTDVTPDGVEVLDPGDLYAGGSAELPATYFDDADHVSATEPDLPGFGSLVCRPPGAMPEFLDHMDLDGFDELTEVFAGQLNGPLLQSSVNGNLGAHPIERLLISFNDDGPGGWTQCGPTFPFSSLPTNSLSPAGNRYGANRDEVLELSVSVGPYPLMATFTGGLNESCVHPILGRDPHSLEDDDDDVDALDVLTRGGVSYFSVDHEGVGGSGMNPSSIYVTSPGGPIEAFSHLRLGMTGDGDVDAFEFVWLPFPPLSNSERALALIYSVDVDDPQTTMLDETGGLDPNAIYAWFLDGSPPFVLIDNLGDDVDAIAGAPMPFLLVSCESLGREFCFGDGGVFIPGGTLCTPCPCGNDTVPGSTTGCKNSYSDSFHGGLGARLEASGSTSLTAADLCFSLSGGAISSFGALISGGAAAPANASNPCFGLNTGIQSPTRDGLRCVVQGTLRHGTRPLDANGDVGVTGNPWGFCTPSFVNSSGFSAGQTRYFEVVYRDGVLGMCDTGLNSSQGIELTFEP